MAGAPPYQRNGKSSTVGYVESLHAKAIELSRLSVEMTAAADSGHPTSASSLAHIVAALMYGHMRYDPSDPGESDGGPVGAVGGPRLSHRVRGGLGAGACGRKRLAHAPGDDDEDDAMRLRAIDSEIDGHPNPAEGFPFFPRGDRLPRTGTVHRGGFWRRGRGWTARTSGYSASSGTARAAKGRYGRRSTS